MDKHVDLSQHIELSQEISFHCVPETVAYGLPSK